jgi:glyoxylase-like metal-dependent hydrolase (beta-lactamase superfamily II)
MEIIQHIYQFKLPMDYEPRIKPSPPSGLFKSQRKGSPVHIDSVSRQAGSNSFVNVYFIEGNQDNLLIDTGLNTPESYETLASELKHYGFTIKDIRNILVTHSHFDHSGQAGKLKEICAAQTIMSAREVAVFNQQYVNKGIRSETALDILKSAGIPPSEAAAYHNVFSTAIDLVSIFTPDRIVENGDIIDIDPFRFTVMETPGHSCGHICLYEPNRKFLFTGDLILPEISPNIGYYPGQGNNPLGEYFKSLVEIYKLEVNLAFPGHGPAFSGLRQITEAIVRHHENRNSSILKVLEKSPKSAYQVAQEIPWNDGGESNFNSMNIFNRRLALGEATSHLEFLVVEGQVRKLVENGINMYYG